MSEDKIICPECGKENDKGSVCCINCGKVLEKELPKAKISRNYPMYSFKKTNNKKQISTIAGLVICIALVGAIVYLNKSTSDPGSEAQSVSTDLSAVLIENDNAAEETIADQSFFYDFRADKAKSDTEFKENLNSIIEDSSSSQEVIDSATALLNQKQDIQTKESSVESEIMNKGYEDALCMIDSDIVRVYVKAGESFTREESADIQQLVENITGLSDIEIESKN